MLDQGHDQSDPRVAFLRQELAGDVDLSGSVAEIGESTWAVHGTIPVDGDVIVAEFATYDEARAALDLVADGSWSDDTE